LEKTEVFFEVASRSFIQPSAKPALLKISSCRYWKLKGGIYVGFALHLSTDYINMLYQGIIEYRKSGKLKVFLNKYDITDWQKD
jgi:hypothetical protein